MGPAGKYCARAWFRFNKGIHFCILALVSLSASPCSDRENMLVSVASAAFDNNMSYYLHLKGFDTVRTNTIRNVNTEELVQRHLLVVVARAPEGRENVAVSRATREPKGTCGGGGIVWDEAQNDRKRTTVCLLLLRKNTPEKALNLSHNYLKKVNLLSPFSPLTLSPATSSLVA